MLEAKHAVCYSLRVNCADLGPLALIHRHIPRGCMHPWANLHLYSLVIAPVSVLESGVFWGNNSPTRFLPSHPSPTRCVHISSLPRSLPYFLPAYIPPSLPSSLPPPNPPPLPHPPGVTLATDTCTVNGRHSPWSRLNFRD